MIRVGCGVRYAWSICLVFLSNGALHPRTRVSVCQDCRQIESQVDDAFRGDDKPPLIVIYVGSRDECADSCTAPLRPIPFTLTACLQVETAR